MQALREFHDTQDSIKEMMDKIDKSLRVEGFRAVAENRQQRRARERQERKDQKKAKATA